jgi:hypothetical protein
MAHAALAREEMVLSRIVRAAQPVSTMLGNGWRAAAGQARAAKLAIILFVRINLNIFTLTKFMVTMSGLALEQPTPEQGRKVGDAAGDSLIVPQPIEIARFGLVNAALWKQILHRIPARGNRI